MTKKEVDKALEDAEFRVAKTMPKNPHSYTLRKNWENDDEFVKVVLHMRAFGVRERFYKTSFIYYYANGYKYWTMGAPINFGAYTEEDTILINRAKV